MDAHFKQPTAFNYVIKASFQSHSFNDGGPAYFYLNDSWHGVPPQNIIDMVLIEGEQHDKTPKFSRGNHFTVFTWFLANFAIDSAGLLSLEAIPFDFIRFGINVNPDTFTMEPYQCLFRITLRQNGRYNTLHLVYLILFLFL